MPASRLAWERYILVALTGSILAIVLVGGTAPRQWAAAAVALALAAIIVGFRGQLDAAATGYRRAVALSVQVALLLLFAIAVYLEFWAGFLLAALCPLAYFAVGMATGHAFVVVYSLAPTVADLVRTDDLLHTVRSTLPWSLVTIAFSCLTATAIGRLEGQRRRSAEQVLRLESHQASVTLHAQHDERRRIAAELHDTVTQGLNGIALLVEAADRTLASDPQAAQQHLQVAAQAARENLLEARALVGALNPAGPEALVDALRHLAQRRGLELGIRVAVQTVGTAAEPGIPAKVALLRIAQEALANLRHAGASQASVVLRCAEGGVTLEITDDGGGFDAATTSPGYGISGMRERAARLGGLLSLRSEPGAGTTVRVELPA